MPGWLVAQQKGCAWEESPHPGAQRGGGAAVRGLREEVLRLQAALMLSSKPVQVSIKALSGSWNGSETCASGMPSNCIQNDRVNK